MELSPIEQIKERLDLVQLVSEYVRLQKSGANYRALCPFHKEKTPSFFVSPSKQIWKCFGCGKGGSIFDFVMEIEGMDFTEAMRFLAKKAGIKLSSAPSHLNTEKEKALEALELSCRFFEKQLWHSSGGQKALEYLKKRGLSENTITEWRLGYAPETRNALSLFLQERGFSPELILKTGVSVRDRELKDRFWGRIIFPIFSISGQVISFAGRVLEKDREPKYLNIPNTLLYDKSRVLFGLNKTKTGILKEEEAIVVEGYMDVILGWQEGTRNMVAVCGASVLSPSHLRQLKRFTQNISFAFDMDEAGQRATDRGVELALSYGFKVKAITLPPGKDPADVILENKEEWENRKRKAVDIIEYFMEVARQNHDLETLEGKEKAGALLLPKIALIRNKVTQGFWIQRTASFLGIREQDLREELKKQSFSFEKESTEEKGESKKDTETWQEGILRAVFYRPQLSMLLKDKEIDFLEGRIKHIVSLFRELGEREKVLSRLSSQDRDYLHTIVFLPEETEVDWEKEFKILCFKGFSGLLQSKIEEVRAKIKRLETDGGDEDLKKELLERLKELSGQLREVYRFKVE